MGEQKKHVNEFKVWEQENYGDSNTKQVQDRYAALMKVWDSHNPTGEPEEDQKRLKDALTAAGYKFLDLEEVTELGSFMDDSFVWSLEDDPGDLAYYVKDGKMFSIDMMRVDLSEPYSEEDNIHDAKSFIDFYENYENLVVNIKKKGESTSSSDEKIKFDVIEKHRFPQAIIRIGDNKIVFEFEEGEEHEHLQYEYFAEAEGYEATIVVEKYEYADDGHVVRDINDILWDTLEITKSK